MFGRTREIRAIERWSYDVERRRHPDPLCFIGAPGMGKTCLLKHARESLRAKHWICGYSEASPNAASAIDDFLEDMRRQLPRGRATAKFLSRLTEINVSAAGIGAGFKLSSAGQRTYYSRLLEIFAAIGDAPGTGVALLIDEAQTLPKDDLRLIIRVINNLENSPVSLIIAGLPGIPTRLGGERDESTQDRVRIPPQLLPLTSEESFDALALPIKEVGGSVEDAQLKRMVHFAEGHPLTLRLLGSQAWELADDDSADRRPLFISARHVAEAIKQTRRQLEVTYYEPMWSRCDKAERKLLIAIAGATGRTWRRLLLPSVQESIQDAPDLIYSLKCNGIISSGDRIQFTIPGFGQFVRRHG